MQMWLRCTVTPGQFPDEYAVGGHQYNGKPFSLFAPAETVQPPPGGRGEGKLQVTVLERTGQMNLVRLPGQTFESGRYYVTVSDDQLTPAAPAAEVA